jgi:REP element-mobilizing transposase RayT
MLKITIIFVENWRRGKNIIANICNKYQYEILELEVMLDHIHIFLSAKPTVAPTDIVRTLKSISAINLFKCYNHFVLVDKKAHVIVGAYTTNSPGDISHLSRR